MDLFIEEDFPMESLLEFIEAYVAVSKFALFPLMIIIFNSKLNYTIQ